MKKIMLSAAVLGAVLFSACGDSKKDAAAADTKTATAPAAVTVNEADWELKNINTVNPDLPSFSVKLPKDAKLERNPDSSGVLVTFKNGYELAIKSRDLISDMKQTIAESRALDVDSSMKLAAVKVLLDDAHGYVYTSQVKSEDGKSVIGDPATHFSFFVDDAKKDLIIIEDSRWAGSMDNELVLFSEANQQKVYSILSSSAVFNK